MSEIRCPSCSESLPEDAAFCPVCGTKIAKVAPSPAPPEKEVDKAPVHTPPPRKGVPTGLRLALAAGLVLALTAVAFVAWMMIGDTAKESLAPEKATLTELVSKEVQPSDKAQVVSHKNEIAVTVPPVFLEAPEKLTISSSTIKGSTDEWEMLRAYDVKFEKLSKFDGLLEIAFGLPPKAMQDPRRLRARYFDVETNRWQPVAYEVDEKNGRMVVYTDHLTTFAPWISKSVYSNPLMKISSVSFPGGKFMEDEEIKQILATYSQGGPRDKEAMLAGWSFVSEWFGIQAQFATLGEHALMFGQLNGINGIMAEMGMLFALVQVGIDFASGKVDAAMFGLLKNVYNYSAVNIINTSYINLAFIAVFAIDYSLNAFAKAAWKGRTDIYQKAYDLYYKEKRQREKINTPWWYKKIKQTIKSTKKAESSDDAVKELFWGYVNEFWRDETVVAEYQSRVMKQGWSGGGGLNEKMKKNISGAHLASIIDVLNRSGVFDRIGKELRMEIQGKLFNRLRYIQKKMNQEYPLKVVVKNSNENLTDEEREASTTGLKVRFAISNDAHDGMWDGRTNEKGEFNFECTGLGWLDAGMPHEVEVMVPSDEKDEEDNLFTAEFKLNKAGKVTVIEVDIAQPPLEGVWKLKSKCTFADLSASLSGFKDASRADKQATSNAMIGRDLSPMPLDLDEAVRSWGIRKDGTFWLITSPFFNKGIGGSQYRIRFTGKDTFEGTLESRSRFGANTNIIKSDVWGTRTTKEEARKIQNSFRGPPPGMR